jgi:hypothetical protein
MERVGVGETDGEEKTGKYVSYRDGEREVRGEEEGEERVGSGGGTQ